jgi:hypothetical protein
LAGAGAKIWSDLVPVPGSFSARSDKPAAFKTEEEASVNEIPTTGPELVRYYNERAAKIGAPLVKRFASIAAAKTRCEKIDADVRGKIESGDIVSSEAEPVSAVSEGNSQSETTVEQELSDMSTQSVNFDKQIVQKKSPPKSIPESIWKGKGPRLQKGSKMSTLIEALSKKAMTRKEMSKLLYGKWTTNVGTILGGVQYVIKGGYVNMTWEHGEKDGEKTYKLVKKSSR